MFRFDPTLEQLPATRDSIAYLAESSNQPIVAVPGRQAQQAQAFVVLSSNGPQSLSLYVCLWLALEQQPAVWTYEEENFSPAAQDELVEEAWHFCESMGFMLDAVDFHRRSGAEQDRILSRLRHTEASQGEKSAAPLVAEPPAVLTPGPAANTGSTPSPAELARLGRLLASF